MARLTLRFFTVCVLIVFLCAPLVRADSSNFEIPDGMVWLNSNRPLKVADLKGKFVLLYFWNHAGLNVQAVVDQCREIQNKYPKSVVLIGIHSGQALDDDDLNRHVVEAMRVYRISYPVAIDSRLQTLKTFRLDRLPAVVLLAPDGSVLTSKLGDRDLFYYFSRVIAKNIPRYAQSINEQVIVFDPAAAQAAVQAPSLESVAHAAEVQDEVVVPGGGPSEPATLNPLVAEAQPVSRFFGEKIKIDREYSRSIGTVYLKLRLPANAHLLGDGQSYVKVSTDDGAVLAKGPVKDPHASVLLDRVVAGRILKIEAMLYYCTDGNKAICRIKGLQFTVPLNDYSKAEDILIEHEISE